VDSGTGSYFTYAYYLMDMLPGQMTQDDLFYLSLGDPDINLPDPPLNHITDALPESLARFRALIEGHERVFWILNPDSMPGYVETYRDALDDDFARVRSEQHADEDFRGALVLEAYERR
jgi:hypothetical protein